MKFALFLGLLVSTTAVAQQPGTKPAAKPAVPKAAGGIPADTAWHDVTKWGVEGRGWADQERKRWFDRLPAKAEGKVTTAVWNLSRDSTGMMVRFKTDAKTIYTRYTLAKTNLAMPHMPGTGVSGLDLYARDAEGKWKWVQVTRPSAAKVETTLITDLAPGEREYAAYLPLYNGVESLEMGVPAAHRHPWPPFGPAGAQCGLLRQWPHGCSRRRPAYRGGRRCLRN